MSNEVAKVDDEGDGGTITIEHAEFIGEIITASFDMTRQVNDRLIDSLTHQVTELHATLDAIRFNVTNLINGDVMPTPMAINRGLWPSEEMVNEFRGNEVY